MDEEPAGGTGKWYSSKTDEQLQQMVDSTPANEPHYRIALGELQRRAAERAENRQLFWIKLTLAATILLGVGGIIATLVK